MQYGPYFLLAVLAAGSEAIKKGTYFLLNFVTHWRGSLTITSSGLRGS